MVIQLLLHSCPGGIEVLIPKIVSEIKDREIKVLLLYDSAKRYECVFHGSGIKPIVINEGRISFFSSAYSLYKFVSRNRDHIYQGHNIGPLFLAVLRLARARKIIYCIHGTRYWRNGIQKIYRKIIWRIALSKEIKLVSNSDYSKTCFRKLIWDRAQINKIYNPIDRTSFFNEKTLYPELPERIIYVGRLAPGKNLHLWMNIAHSISKRYDTVSFDIYGSGILRNDLEKYAQERGLSNKINFHGFVKDIAQSYQKGDLLIFLSEYESFGNVVVESILSGTPVICSNIPAMQEIFGNYSLFLVDLDPDIEERVHKKIMNYKELVHKTKDAQMDFIGRFSMKNYISKLEALYSEFEKQN